MLCGNDEIAIGLLRGLGERGVRVPDDISVIGFDDHPLGKMLTPSLQIGINQDGADLSKLGAHLEDKAAKSAAVRVFRSGERRLGRYADFLTRYPVKLRNGRIGSHFALANELMLVSRGQQMVRAVRHHKL